MITTCVLLDRHRRTLSASFRSASLLLLVLALSAGSFAQTTGVELRIADETVPPGGMLQLKVQITEPRPISKGGQRTSFRASFLGPVQGIALFSAAGDATGTAILSQGSAHFSIKSTIFDMGTNVDYPIVTIAMPVKSTATPGSTASLVLDPSISQWLDPSAKNYPILLTNGILTVGGTLSISNIVPGGGIVRAGTKIAILGIGFQPDSKVQIENADLGTQTFLNAHEIDVTLRADTNLTASRVRITNRSNEVATYYSYQRMTALGKSTHPLIAATVPLFAKKTWTIAYFRPTLGGSQFSAIALENPTAQPAKVNLQLFASNGTVLKSHSVQLMPGQRWSRDLVEWFVGVTPGNGTSLKVTSNFAIPMLGLLGDDALGTVDAVDPSANP